MSNSNAPKETNAPSSPQSSIVASAGSVEPSDDTTDTPQSKTSNNPHDDSKTAENTPGDNLENQTENPNIEQGSTIVNPHAGKEVGVNDYNSSLSFLPMLGKNTPSDQKTSVTKENTTTPGAVVATGGKVDYSLLDKIKAFFF